MRRATSPGSPRGSASSHPTLYHPAPRGGAAALAPQRRRRPRPQPGPAVARRPRPPGRGPGRAPPARRDPRRTASTPGPARLARLPGDARGGPASRRSARPYRNGFDPLARGGARRRRAARGRTTPPQPTCTKGRARRASWTAGEERYEVESQRAARTSWCGPATRGGLAGVRPTSAPVRPPGERHKHRAVAASVGPHQGGVGYEAPGLLPASRRASSASWRRRRSG